MPLMRNVFLLASQSRWLREHARRYGFMRRTVARFMPGETADEALAAAGELQRQNIGSVLTHLGENITDPDEAEQVTQHYLGVLGRVRAMALPTEVSVKPTQLGLDLSVELCYSNLLRIIECAREQTGSNVVWIDMEASSYTDATLDLYRRARGRYPNVGVCLQAYLRRTAGDLNSLLPLGPAIRLVKGAYKEPPARAFQLKREVDENFFVLSQRMLNDDAQRLGIRAAIATHDAALIRRIVAFAESRGRSRNDYEFQMLYGIQSAEQLRLAREDFHSIVLIAYGHYWFPWFMRRIAERPANAWLALRNILE